MNKQENILNIINKASKKDYLYLVYFLLAFALFGSLGAFDILTNFIGETTNFSYFNLVIGIIFSLVALGSLVLIVIFFIKPSKLLEIDFKKQEIKVNRCFKKCEIINFKDLYFVNSNEASFLGFVMRYGVLKLYKRNGKKITINFLSNAKTLKNALEILLSLSDKNIYPNNNFMLFFIRLYQYFLAFFLKFLHFFKPKVLSSYEDVSNILVKKNISKVLLVESNTIYNKNLDDNLIKELENKSIYFSRFYGVHNNPHLEDVKSGKEKFLNDNCKAIIAIGGGSILDASKGIAAIAYSKKDITKFKGLFKIRHKVPLLIAIPTTCGTGSETTFVSVLTDESSKVKFEIISNKITPKYALLDEKLLESLPTYYVASTAMDAFSHALESYLNITRTRKTKKESLFAMKLIYENLIASKDDPDNLIYKRNLLNASFIAGKAFNRAFVGPVHALSHAIGGKYNLDHGYLNAILMPRFLRVYLFTLYKDMAKIARYLNISNTNDVHDDAKSLITYLEGIISTFEFQDYLTKLDKKDIPELASKAYKEAHLLYPSKKFVNVIMYEDIMLSLLKE